MVMQETRPQCKEQLPPAPGTLGFSCSWQVYVSCSWPAGECIKSALPVCNQVMKEHWSLFRTDLARLLYSGSTSSLALSNHEVVGETWLASNILAQMWAALFRALPTIASWDFFFLSALQHSHPHPLTAAPHPPITGEAAACGLARWLL